MRDHDGSLRDVTRPLGIAAIVLAVLYAVQLAGPLRVDTDSSFYLNLATAIADGRGFNPPGEPSFPPGLPALLGGLDAIGLGAPWAFTLLNFAFLLLGIGSVAIVLRVGLELSTRATSAICLLIPLSVYVLKSTLMPLSEIPFFGVASLAVALLVLAHRRGDPVLLGAAMASAAASCTIRTAGVALVPAIVLAFRTTRGRVVAAASSLLLGIGAAILTPRYLDELRAGWEGGLIAAVGRHARALAVQLGAALANVPFSRVDSVEPLLVIVGTVGLILALVTAFRRRRVLAPVDGWLLGSVALVYAWPSGHPRFVLPFLPVLAAYIWLGAGRKRWPVVGWAGLIVVSGLVAMAISIRLAYSGTQFPERYARGVLAPTYRVAWGIERPGDRQLVDASALRALERYDPDPPGL